MTNYTAASRTATPTHPLDPPENKHFPRLLCLHGGGVNASVFQLQSRLLTRHLQQSFRLVWAEGPFLCHPHSDIVTVYGTLAPFRRWLRWLPEQAHIDAESAIDEIGYSIRMAMEEDDAKGGEGEWVGLMGFSQGAKLAASLLLEQQARERRAKEYGTKIEPGLIGMEVNWRFGILLAGRAPMVNLNPRILEGRSLYDAGGISEESFNYVAECDVEPENVLAKPTLHVHGMADPGLHLHRWLYEDYCTEESKVLVEWEGTHRIPVKTPTVEKVVRAIYNMAETTGVKVKRTVV